MCRVLKSSHSPPKTARGRCHSSLRLRAFILPCWNCGVKKGKKKITSLPSRIYIAAIKRLVGSHLGFISTLSTPAAAADVVFINLTSSLPSCSKWSIFSHRSSSSYLSQLIGPLDSYSVRLVRMSHLDIRRPDSRCSTIPSPPPPPPPPTFIHVLLQDLGNEAAQLILNRWCSGLAD